MRLWSKLRSAVRSMVPLPRVVLQLRIKRQAAKYDMYALADEQFFAELYLYYVGDCLARVFGNRPLRILDLGCGSGRLSHALARRGHDVLGVDFAEGCIELAESHRGNAEQPPRFMRAEIGDYLREYSLQQFDVVFCTEVLYMLEDGDLILDTLLRAIPAGGVLVLAVRPAKYYISLMAAQGSLSSALQVAFSHSGRLFGWRFHWTTAEDLRRQLQTARFDLLDMAGIGIFSGLEGDPQGRLAIPSKFSPEERAQLLKLELQSGRACPDCGRYILAIAKKRVN